MSMLVRQFSQRLLVITLLVTPNILQAQTLDVATLRAEAKSGNAAAQRTLGEALVLGSEDISANAVAGAGYLEQAVAQGDVAAKTVLGTILLDGALLELDPVRGKILLEQAVAAGDTAAMTELGAALLWGTVIERDTQRAVGLLDHAAEQGDVKAKRTLGEAMIVGLIAPTDIETGLALMEEAVASGDTEAQIALGKLLLSGEGVSPDLNRATALFETAANAGNGAGLEELGSHLMWIKRKRMPAEDYLRRAGELGQVTAWETLAAGAMYGYLGSKNRGKFDEFASKARAAGSERIEVLAAERLMWGISKRASGPKAIKILERAAEEGNATALKELIGLVRNGNKYNVRKRPAQARAYLERFAELLTPAEIDYYAYSVDAAQARTRSLFPSLAEQYSAKDQHIRITFAEDLYAANPNLVMYMLQTDMKRRGEYTGNLNGLATQKTINALNRACKQLPYDRDCRENVLSPGVIKDLLSR